ncbi:cation diffusion facilitator family transporter [Paraburkholderia sp. LEh10]|uniref:cation diffusion facilitator family transporter n=1 Tax=Paraburkholderia sp. LEh10 TaxID=2821353 RepID=UPI001AE2F494|nr:cation diffusion facilitator family transporter [Paraburkholderia sp. LEh10]MBP0589576.1 cation diffusion facilitator family transporter [Paraburkholderia sp. LEh10]
MATPRGNSKKVVYIALFGDILIVCTKIAAAIVTGSAAMLSEAVHSIVDSANEALLLYGYSESERRPDTIHPLGYGRELYFWSFIVSLMLFGFGAGVSLYQGTQHVLSPKPIEYAFVNYVVLAFSFVFEGVSWFTAFRSLRETRGKLSYWEAIHKSKDPPSFMVLLEDSAALVSIIAAATGIFLSHTYHFYVMDGFASIMIGLVLATVAAIIANESKSLLIGEGASPALVTSILDLTVAEPGVVSANGVFTVHLSPDQVLVALSVEFDDAMQTPQLERCVVELESRIRSAHPEVVILFVKPQTKHRYQEWKAARYRAGTLREK